MTASLLFLHIGPSQIFYFISFLFVLLHAVNLHFINFFLYLPVKAGLLLKEVLLVPSFYIFFQYFRAECDSLKGFPILKIKFS